MGRNCSEANLDENSEKKPKKAKRKLLEVSIATLAGKPWVRKTNPFSIHILLASDNLIVTRVAPGDMNDTRGYGVFYCGSKTMPTGSVIYECDVEGISSQRLIELVNASNTK